MHFCVFQHVTAVGVVHEVSFVMNRMASVPAVMAIREEPVTCVQKDSTTTLTVRSAIVTQQG